MSHTDIDGHVSERLGDHLEGDLSLAEFARIDAHLAHCAECANELRELRATVALLRSLPDPEPPVDFSARVARRLASGEGRRVSLAGRVAEPRFVAALAAGFAGLLAVTSFTFGAGSFLGPPSDPSQELAALRSGSESATVVRAARASRPLSLHRAPVVHGPGSVGTPAPRALVALDGPLRDDGQSGFGFLGRSAPEVPLRDLDGELEALMRNPAAFIEQLRRTSEEARRPMVAPLVEHSARRGDAAAVARYAGFAARPATVSTR